MSPRIVVVLLFACWGCGEKAPEYATKGELQALDARVSTGEENGKKLLGALVNINATQEFQVAALKNIQEGLGRDKDGNYIVLRDLHDVKVILGVGTEDAVTKDDVEAMKKYLKAQNDRVVWERSGQTVALATGPDIPAPGVSPRPEPRMQSQPTFDPRYEIISRGQDCIAICDRHTGWSYQWVREQSGWRLLLWQQSHCSRCGRVHAMWTYTQPPQGFPTP